MKVKRQLLLSIIVFIAFKSDSVSCGPLSVAADKPSNGSSNTTSDSPQLTPSPDEFGNPAGADPPLIFPDDRSLYKIVENDTALKILQAHAAAKDDSQVQGQEIPVTATLSRDHGDDSSVGSIQKSSSDPSPVSSSYDDDDDDDYSSEDDDDKPDEDDDAESDGDEDGTIDNEVENIQPEDTHQKDGLEEQFRNGDTHFPLVIDNTMIEVSAIRQEHLWAFVVGVIFVLTVVAYIAMVLYRNRLEKRYGMRQRLVTEDDYYTNNDF